MMMNDNIKDSSRKKKLKQKTKLNLLGSVPVTAKNIT